MSFNTKTFEEKIQRKAISVKQVIEEGNNHAAAITQHLPALPQYEEASQRTQRLTHEATQSEP